MNARSKVLATALLLLGSLTFARAQEQATNTPRHLTLAEAVQLALKHNHLVRIAGYHVEEKEHAKEKAKSEYFPTLRNGTRAFSVTDTQFIQIGAGELGTVAGTPVPATPVTISQGGKTFVFSDTGLTQPLTQLFTKVKPQNDAASAELGATRADAQQTENEVALTVHQLYYSLLITQLHQSATEARIKAAEDLQNQRTQEVKYGNALDEDLIESRAQTLQAKQELLTTELQLSNLSIQLDDVTGLPLSTQLELDPSVPGVQSICEPEECVKTALQSHPEIVAAREQLRKASAGVQLSKADYVPDITAFARYDYQNDVPFLARNFGSFGFELTYDLFDGGKRRAAVRESDAQVDEAKENLARVTDDVELKVKTALNKLDRTKEMVDVSEQVVALRDESSRVTSQKLLRGEALQSQADAAAAQELDAKALLLQSQLGYLQAHDELLEAMGVAPQ
ncbi:MAG: TolC family protein [Candidatus Acidiferrales bacterium]